MEFTDIQRIRTLITPQGSIRHLRAVEIGKWANGLALTADQTAYCLQAIIIYDTFNKGEPDRVGYVADARRGCRRETTVAVPTSISDATTQSIDVVDMSSNRDEA